MKPGVLIVSLTLILAAFAALLWLRYFARGFSARDQPSCLERWLASEARHLAMPAEAKRLKNPVA